MPVPLVTQHYPDDFQVLTYHFTAVPADPTPLLYADRALVIDSIVVGIRTASTAAGSGALSFEKSAAPNGASGTVLAVASTDDDNVDAGDYVIFGDGVDSVRRYNSSGALQTTATGTTKLSWTENSLNAGQWLVIDVTGTITSFTGMVQVRYRSRVA